MTAISDTRGGTYMFYGEDEAEYGTQVAISEEAPGRGKPN